MNYLIITVLFLIIILSSYLIYNNYQEYNVLEKFTSNIQNSVDSDDYQIYTNQLTLASNVIQVGWNGLWIDTVNKINSQFLQVNDKLIVVLSNINTSLNSPNTQNTSKNESQSQCSNIFLGIANLDSTRQIFRITNYICNQFKDPSSILNPYQNPYFTGQINTTVKPMTITLYPQTSSSTNSSPYLTLTLNQSYTGYSNESYPYLNNYIQQISPFLQNNPTLPDTLDPSKSLNSFEYNPQECPANTTPCFDNKNGLTNTSYQPNSSNINACCNIDKTTNCLLNASTPYISQCPNTTALNHYSNNNAPLYLLGNSGNSLNMCNMLNYYTNTLGQVAILCYVTNLSNVQTLNYEFFGVQQNESSLTLQYDMMNSKLSNNLNLYQSFGKCTNNMSSAPILRKNAYSFTNCYRNSASNTLSNMGNDCCKNIEEYITSNILPTKINNSLLPTVWEINSNEKYNIINSCPFTLNTSRLYNVNNTPVKYIVCNDDNTISLSLNNGNGSNNNLYMDDSIIINTGPNETNRNLYYAITTNIRTNNGSYLVPSDGMGGFYNNSTQVSLANSPEPNGKWLILGFTLNKITDLTNIINSYTF